ncbi:forkhead transcription factor-like protein [Westerdykella ornata]|uniref:Forkhead transcription factor-like protein n=1 Tax=Westerdykella ornata TaxID=318751 RepID=A0A6A6JGD2_WESOR|nr:forkhead transcription factor-like protein [Westerdykella ornata]KAF2275274.1 forkhead transcription factor-like protein [Westerdykella ornata]
MAATRRQPPLQIFEDPNVSTAHHDIAQYASHTLEPHGPVTDVSVDHHTLLQPPEVFTQAPSPKKGRHPSSSPPPRALTEKGLNAVALPRPPEQLFRTDAPVKRVQRPIPKQSQMMAATGAPVFTNFASQLAQFDKENLVPESSNAVSRNFSTEAIKPANKRRLSDAAPQRDRNKKTKVPTPRSTQEDGPLPEPHEMPPVEDDGTKPLYSYANLIGMAILRAPNRRLTLAQIYKWISDTFAFYRNQPDCTGWQNSIRHNLSISKSFSKQERPKDDPGKGHYWRINPGFEKQYYKSKPVRRPTNPDGFVQTNISELARPMSSSASFPPLMSTVKSIDSSKFPEEPELSSDATIPCSDPTCHDGVDPVPAKAPTRAIPSSPPAADIKSSPPPIARAAREDTPPRIPAPRLPSNSRSGGRKRKFGFGDSGYYSSIESSATKGHPLGTLLTSEADAGNYRLKRGRAEEEIVRIRGSSYDSPTKSRPTFKHPGDAPLASSPLRANQKLPEGPLTPAVVFKRPALPPASVSPNTNLRNHRNRMRELVGSPDKNMPVLNNNTFLDSQSWSPAVQGPNDENVNLVGDGFFTTFDIFGDYPYQESPLKPSAKRPRLERAATTSSILADVTGVDKHYNTASPRPYLRSPFHELPGFSLSPLRQNSPMKAPTSAPVPELPVAPTSTFTTTNSGFGLKPTFAAASAQSAPADDDLFNLLHSDESEPGIDLLKGFEKIGARSAVAPNGSPTKVSHPGLGRSSTARF